MSNLFKEEVVGHQINRFCGDIIVFPKSVDYLILIFLLIWISLTAFWLVSSTYGRKETVLAWLETPEGVTRVYPENFEIIKQILLQEDDFFVLNQLLVTGDHFLVDSERLENRLLEEYKSQYQILSEQFIPTSNPDERSQHYISQQNISVKQDISMLGNQLITLNVANKRIEAVLNKWFRR